MSNKYEKMLVFKNTAVDKILSNFKIVDGSLISNSRNPSAHWNEFVEISSGQIEWTLDCIKSGFL